MWGVTYFFIALYYIHIFQPSVNVPLSLVAAILSLLLYPRAKKAIDKTYMLDTNIYSFILREQLETVIKRQGQAVLRNHRIAISAITRAEVSKAAREAGLATQQLAGDFCARLHAILLWEHAAVDAATDIKAALATAGAPICPNDKAIAAGAILVTRNGVEFERMPRLKREDWVK